MFEYIELERRVWYEFLTQDNWYLGILYCGDVLLDLLMKAPSTGKVLF
jgi:hypothetical protein